MRHAQRIALAAAVIVFGLHLAANPHYGFFRDELYFIICGFHPQFGYVDQPPVVPLLAASTQSFGHSLFLLRAMPAIFAAAGAYVCCMLAFELGGGAFAMAFSALVYFLTPVLASFGMKVSTDMVGLWTWPLLALLAVRIAKGGDARLWLLAGAAAGLSLQSKYSVIFFLAALVLGLLLTPQRRLLFTRWFGAGAAIAVVVALPNFLWQAHNGYPMIELLEAGQNGKNEIVSAPMYLLQELLITGGLLALVWLAGLVWLFRSAEYRFLAYAYVLLVAMMIALHGKHYYPADVYPIVIAAGAVAVERATSGARGLRPIAFALAVVFGAPLLPMVLPILPESDYVAYASSISRALHVSSKATETEPGRDAGRLPGDWADMHGWEHLAATVRRVYENLPKTQRAQAVVKTSNYGEASAIAFFAPDVPVISAHNQFWLWGPRGYTGNVLIDVHGDCGASSRAFRSARLAATIRDRWAIGYENGIPVMVCEGIREPLQRLWPLLKDYS